MNKDEISAQHDAEKTREELLSELELAKSRLREVDEALQSITDGVVVYDAEGNISRMNQAAREIFGYSDGNAALRIEERIDTLDLRGVHGEAIPFEAFPTVRALAGETVKGFRMAIRRRSDNAVRILSASAAPIQNGDREVTGAVATVTDITRQVNLTDDLARNESYLRQLIDSLPGLVWTTDAEGTVDFVSRRRLEYTGAALENRLGDGIFSSVHPDDYEHSVERWMRSVETEEPYNAEYRIRRQDGEYRWFKARAAALRDDDGRIMKWFGICIDINDLKGAEHALAESEDRFRRAMESVPDAVVICDRDLRIRYVNSAVQRVTGLPVVDMLGKPASEALSGTLHEALSPAILQAFDSGTTWTLDTGIVFPDGTARYFLISCVPLSDETGAVGEVMCIAHDYTERIEAQKQIEEARARAEAILGNLTEGVFIFDLDGRILDLNPAAVKINGFRDVGEALRNYREFTDDFELFSLDGRPVPVSQWPVPRVLRGEHFTNYELRIERRRTGYGFWGSYTGIPVRNDEGVMLFGVFTVRDITSIRLAEESLHRLNETLELRVRERTLQLESANRELEAFSYSVSHDLRAPLRSIDGFSKVLLERHASNLDEQGRNYLARVRNAAQRMGRLIDDMLNLSRIGRKEMSLGTVDLSRLARETMEELASSEPGRNVSVSITPGMTATGDEALLRIVFSNLLSNAWKFTGRRDDARIEIGMRKSEFGTEFFVRDDGAGFPMEYVDKLFTPFQRLHTEEEFPGTGIGLAIVARIIARHGGSVRAESSPGGGAMFMFTLGGSHER